jgi:nitrite reductase (NADH) small subunit
MSWIKITEIENIPVREGRAVKLNREEIAVFNLGDRFAAIDNKCPHSGGPLCDGIVSGSTVVCPLHGWKICLDSGDIVKPQVPVRVEVYPVRVADGVIEVDMPERQPMEDRGGKAA